MLMLIYLARKGPSTPLAILRKLHASFTNATQEHSSHWSRKATATQSQPTSWKKKHILILDTEDFSWNIQRPQVQKQLEISGLTDVHEVNELNEFTSDITWNLQNNSKSVLLRFYFLTIECSRKVTALHCFDLIELIQDTSAKAQTSLQTVVHRWHQTGIRFVLSSHKMLYKNKRVNSISLQESPQPDPARTRFVLAKRGPSSTNKNLSINSSSNDLTGK